MHEGRRRLSMPLLEQTATGFIAGVTIVFGPVAAAIDERGPAVWRRLLQLWVSVLVLNSVASSGRRLLPATGAVAAGAAAAVAIRPIVPQRVEA